MYVLLVAAFVVLYFVFLAYSVSRYLRVRRRSREGRRTLMDEYLRIVAELEAAGTADQGKGTAAGEGGRGRNRSAGPTEGRAPDSGLRKPWPGTCRGGT